jgi:hypothetical protein
MKQHPSQQTHHWAMNWCSLICEIHLVAWSPIYSRICGHRSWMDDSTADIINHKKIGSEKKKKKKKGAFKTM